MTVEKIKELYVELSVVTKGAEAKLRNLGDKVGGLTRGFNLLDVAMIGAYASGIGLLGKGLVSTTLEMQGLEASLTSILERFNTGQTITQKINSEIGFLTHTADRLGVSLQDIQTPYVQFLASSKDNLQTSRKIITSFLSMSSVFKLSAEQTKLVVKAIQQMSSKGRISAEELRGQLGDQLPGAVGLFAEAMGKSEAQFLKLMEQGKVSSDVLSDVADLIQVKYAKSIEKSTQNLTAKINRFNNSWYRLKVSFGEAIIQGFSLSSVFDSLSSVVDRFRGFFARLDQPSQNFIMHTGLMLVGIPLLGHAIRFLTSGVLIFGSALKLVNTLMPGGKIFKVVGAVMKWVGSNKILTGTLLVIGNYIQENIGILSIFKTAILAIIDVVKMLFNSFGQLLDYSSMVIDKVWGFISPLFDKIAEYGELVSSFASSINPFSVEQNITPTLSTPAGLTNNNVSNKNNVFNFNFENYGSAEAGQTRTQVEQALSNIISNEIYDIN
jgi:tape measure domain-containing protein